MMLALYTMHYTLLDGGIILYQDAAISHMLPMLVFLVIVQRRDSDKVIKQ